MPIQNLVFFALALACFVYIGNCIVAKRIIPIETKQALLYITAVAMLGVIAEILIGTLYQAIVGQPLWVYTVYPVHSGYTSHYAVFLWGIYGFQMYLLHDTLRRRNIVTRKQLAVVTSIEAILFEAIVNLLFLFVFGRFIYYYLPGDLWHLTSIQTLPFYLLAGFVIVEVIARSKSRPLFFAFLCALVAGSVVSFS